MRGHTMSNCFVIAAEHKRRKKRAGSLEDVRKEKERTHV